MKVDAVFVDGVGHVREMAIARAVPTLDIPALADPVVAVSGTPSLERPPATTRHSFDRLGALPDGRLVYAFHFARGPQFGLWGFSHDLDLSTDSADARAAVEQQLVHEIQAIAGLPVVRLYDHTATLTDERILRRRVMGVGRKLSDSS